MTERIRYHTDLDVWKVSKDLAVELYRVTDKFPAREIRAFGSDSKERVLRACKHS